MEITGDRRLRSDRRPLLRPVDARRGERDFKLALAEMQPRSGSLAAGERNGDINMGLGQERPRTCGPIGTVSPS